MTTMTAPTPTDTTVIDRARILKSEHGMGTGHALSWARSEHRARIEYPYTDNVKLPDCVTPFGYAAATIKLDNPVDGFDIYIVAAYDEYPDYSFYGEWSTHWTDGAVQNDKWRNDHDYGYNRHHRNLTRWFVPMSTYDERREWLSKAGYSRGNAHRLATEGIRDDMRRARGGDDNPMYFITAYAVLNGHVMGEDSIGGVGFAEGAWGTALIDEMVMYATEDVVPEAVYLAHKHVTETRPEVTFTRSPNARHDGDFGLFERLIGHQFDVYNDSGVLVHEWVELLAIVDDDNGNGCLELATKLGTGRPTILIRIDSGYELRSL